jgi:hypothetical protein
MMGTYPSYASLTTPSANDILLLVDVLDTSMSPQGTTKQITVGNLAASTFNTLDWINVVQEFGADPTGTNDSSTAFQNALTSLQSAGGVLYIPTGNYLIGTALTYTANKPLRITGDSPGASVLLANSSSSNIVYLTITSTNRLVIDNWSLNNNVNSSAFTNTNIGIKLVNLTFASFIHHTQQTAAASNRINQNVVLVSCTGVNFYACDLRSYVNGVVMEGSPVVTAAVNFTNTSFGQNNGSGVSTAASIYMNGTAATLGLNTVYFNSGDRSLLLTGGTGANPSFVWGYNVQSNNCAIVAFEFNTGAEVWMDGAWVTTNSSNANTNAVQFGINWQGEAYFGKSLFAGFTGHTISIAGGTGFTFSDCQFGDSGGGKSSASTYNMINVGAAVNVINIADCQFNVAPYAGFGTTKPNVAININSGVSEYHIHDNIFASSGYASGQSCADLNANPQRFGFTRNINGFDYKDSGSGSAIASINTAETIVCQMQVNPYDLLSGSLFEFKIFGQYTNGVASQTNTVQLRAGTAGTTSDTSILSLAITSSSSTGGATNVILSGQAELVSPGTSGTGKGWMVSQQASASYGGGVTSFQTANVSNWNTTTSVWLTLTFQSGNASNILAVTDSIISKVA